MYLVLLSVGLLITAAGFLTVGFGIPINAFSLGNTLIIAGTVSVVGGLILIGLASAIRQLNRIADAVSGRGLPRPAKAAEPAAAATVDSLVPPTARIPPAAVRAPAPSKPPEAVMPRPAAEPHFPAAASEQPAPLDWMRPKRKATPAPVSESDIPPVISPPASAEPTMMEVPDEAPLSPRAPQRPLFSPPPPFTRSTRETHQEQPDEPKSFEAKPFESKPWTPSRNGASDARPHDMPPPPLPRSEQIARTTPTSARDTVRDYGQAPARDAKETGKPAGRDAGLFDVVWPDARSAPMSSEPPRREAKPEPVAPPPRAREETQPETRAESVSSAPAAVSILKSGVIDGMAYTLYVDGSIEAELPQGTVKFASVDALRAHLEKSV